MKNTLFVFILLSYSCRNYERVCVSDLEDLIRKKQIANEKLVEEAERRDKRYGYNTDIVNAMKSVHNEYSSFFDTLDNFGHDFHHRVSQFQKRTLQHLTDFPQEFLIEADAPPTLAKLQIVESENIILRSMIGVICPRYDGVKLAIIPSKNVYRPGESIKGQVVSFVYYTGLKAKFVLNQERLDLVDGVASFTIDPGNAIGSFQLNSSMALGDTVLKASTSVFISN